MYKLCPPNLITNEIDQIQRLEDNAFIPVAVENFDYQKFLEHLNTEGSSIVEGDLPESVLEHAADAAQQKFNEKLDVYTEAVARLAQYILSEGRPEIKAMRPNGQRNINPETLEYEDVIVEMVIQTAIDPLPETVEIWEGAEKKTVPNPVIVQDEQQRAAAQAIVDATPQEVKDAA